MTIRYSTDSIFMSRAYGLVNPVNTVGTMGSGLAAQFKLHYPEMYLEYRDYCRDGLLEIGKLHLFVTYDDRLIINFPTKKHWMYKSKVEYIAAGLSTLKVVCGLYRIKSLAIPKLGCGKGLGSLDWDKDGIHQLMHNTFVDSIIDVCLYV